MDNTHVVSDAVDRAKGDDTSPALADNKVATLCAYWQAQGSCQYCVEKWSHGHKCAPTVQLHVV
jgi:hypothetical protein